MVAAGYCEGAGGGGLGLKLNGEQEPLKLLEVGSIPTGPTKSFGEVKDDATKTRRREAYFSHRSSNGVAGAF